MPLPPLSEVVDRALDQDRRRYETLLAALYAAPQAAREAFDARATEAGALKAGNEMATSPARFGDLATGNSARVSALAREAGFVAVTSHLLQNERRPEAVASVLNERFFQGAQTVFADAGVMFRAWREVVDVEGPTVAATRLESAPETFGALRPGASRYARALASRGMDAEIARAHARAHQHERGNGPTPMTLPRTVEELANREGGRLPRPLEMKLEALSADFRGMLSRAYRDPARAEATFSEIAGRDGLQATVLAVRQEPSLLGTLSDAPDAAEVAYRAAKRGARAHELNAIRNPSQAAEVMQREAERSLARQVANPAEALQRLQTAMRRHGVDRVADEVRQAPQRYFTARDDQTLNPSALASEVRAVGNANRAADEYVESEIRRQQPERAPVVSPTAEAEAAVQAHAETTQLHEKKGDLHEVLNDAANAARRAEDAVKWHDIYQSQLRRSLGQIYANPAAAEAEFHRVADRDGHAAAIEHLTKKPQKLGALAPDRSAAREAARSAGGLAFSYLTVREKLANVEWRDQGGTVHRGVADVRAATTSELRSSAADLADAETRMHGLGGVDGSRERAVAKVQALSPEQADELIAALKARNPRAGQAIQMVRDTAAARREGQVPVGATHAVIQTVQVARTMGEGPTG